MSEGRPISCGANSISDSPALLVKVAYIEGSNLLALLNSVKL